METENGDSKSKMEDYAVLESIGRGAFGAAFLVLNKTENTKYVLKKIHLSKQTEKFKIKACQEMDLIAKLRHPYILEYKDAWVEKGSCICIVTNYCEVGNISEIMRKAKRSYFPEEKICKWLTQLLLAIDYLHLNRVLHRDLKLSNIFITKEDDIRLGDFGLAKLLNEEGLASSVAGTPNYMCPELLEATRNQYGYKSDIWSLGCCIFEIAARQQAFKAPDMTGLINKINRSLISPLPIVYSSNLKQIIKSMLRKSPEHRPTAAELLRHPHLQPFLLRCQNTSTVFLPVKSPSPNNTKEKTKKPSTETTKKPSPTISSGSKESKEREAKLKHRDLLPLFEENNHTQYLSLLDDFVLIEDQLQTKRVDPTSYSGKISTDSEDSRDNYVISSLKESISTIDGANLPSSENKEEYPVEQVTKLENADTESERSTDAGSLHGPHETLEPKSEAKDAVCSDVSSNEDNLRSQINEEQIERTQREKEKEEDRLVNQAPNDKRLLDAQVAVGGDKSKDQKENPRLEKADALESLLELCASLLKEDKFDELNGVLKPFGDDAVSSRETAIWLTKSLMNAQKKLDKES